MLVDLRPFHHAGLLGQAIDEPLRFLTADDTLAGYSELVDVI